MIRKITLLFFIIPLISIYSQNYEIVKVVSEQIYTINGGLNSAFGGKSRLLVPVKLPKNTIQWYYAFSANKSKNGISQAKAFTSLASIKDRSGMLEKTINESLNNLGDAVCDIYVLDKNNSEYFINKNGFYPIQSTENLKKGLVKLDKTFNNIYLGLKNPNKYIGVHITIEVFAIVKKVSNKETWSTEIKNAVHKYYLNLFSENESNLFSKNEKRMLANCVSEKTFMSYTVDEYLKISKDNVEHRKALKNISIPCLIEILGRELTDDEKRMIKYF